MVSEYGGGAHAMQPPTHDEPPAQGPDEHSLGESTRWAWPSTPELVAVVVSLLGLVAAIPGVPTGASAPLFLLFVLGGPGAIVQRALHDVTPVTRWSLIPVFGLSVMVLISAAAVTIGFYAPRPMLAITAAVVLILAADGVRRHTSRGNA